MSTSVPSYTYKHGEWKKHTKYSFKCGKNIICKITITQIMRCNDNILATNLQKINKSKLDLNYIDWTAHIGKQHQNILKMENFH
jgi:hypothetical protein